MWMDPRYLSWKPWLAGRPVAVSDIPANLEWVQDGINGWIFRDGDENGLARVMVQSSGSTSQLGEMSSLNRKLVERKADWNKNSLQLFEAYKIAREVRSDRYFAIIQARMSSSRLPGKVLLDICGKPMLERVLDRVSLARQIDHVQVATTADPSDDSLVEWCERHGVDCFRGSMQDVLDRFYQAALLHKPQFIARITADCPVIDPGLIDETIQACRENGVDFSATRLPPPFHRTYPIGLDVEVSTFSALKRAWREAAQPAEREHVFPYLYDQTGRFNLKILNHDPDFGSLRWTVDTAEDLELIRRIYSHLLPREDFGWEEVLDLVDSQPELTASMLALHIKVTWMWMRAGENK